MEAPGTRLRAWRKERELTLEQFTDRLGLEIHWTTVSHVERDTRSPGRQLANAIERVTGIRSTDWDEWDEEKARKRRESTGGEAA